MRRLMYAPAMLALLTLGVACDEADQVLPPPTHTPATVEITPGTATLLVGDTYQLAAEVLCHHGLTLDVPVSWATDDPAVASVDEATGLVTALTQGGVTISAKAGPAEGSVVLNVAEDIPEAGWLVIEPEGPFVIRPQQHLRLKATVYDENGTPRPDWEIKWVSSDDQCAAVFQNGLVRGRYEGPTVITASSHGVSDFVEVEVIDPLPPVFRVDLEPQVMDLWVGQEGTVEAFAYDAQGRRIFDWVDWSSADPDLVTVDANGEGVTTVKAIARAGIDRNNPDPIAVEITGVCGGVPGTMTVWVNEMAKIDDP